MCNLNEIGYSLADNQRDLTTIQKLFLFHAYPIFNRSVKKQIDTEEQKEPTDATEDEREAFRERYKKAMEENRAKIKNRKK